MLGVSRGVAEAGHPAGVPAGAAGVLGASGDDGDGDESGLHSVLLSGFFTS
jgi:hypothetical protein